MDLYKYRVFIQILNKIIQVQYRLTQLAKARTFVSNFLTRTVQFQLIRIIRSDFTGQPYLPPISLDNWLVELISSYACLTSTYISWQCCSQVHSRSGRPATPKSHICWPSSQHFHSIMQKSQCLLSNRCFKEQNNAVLTLTPWKILRELCVKFVRWGPQDDLNRAGINKGRIRIGGSCAFIFQVSA